MNWVYKNLKTQQLWIWINMKDKEVYQRIAEEQPYCQLCGGTNMLEIHHIYYRSQGGLNDERNLIRLCKNCHMMVHGNKKRWQPFLLNMQYNKYGEFKKEDVTKRKKPFYQI